MALQAHGAAGRARTRPARADATAGVCGAFPAMVANPARTACDWRGTRRTVATVERRTLPAHGRTVAAFDLKPDGLPAFQAALNGLARARHGGTGARADATAGGCGAFPAKLGGRDANGCRDSKADGQRLRTRREESGDIGRNPAARPTVAAFDGGGVPAFADRRGESGAAFRCSPRSPELLTGGARSPRSNGGRFRPTVERLRNPAARLAG